MPSQEQSVKTDMSSVLPTKKKDADLTSLFSLPLYRHIPWHNLYLFYLSLISVSLQFALYRSLLIHITALHPPPPPLSVTLTDADIAYAHFHSLE